MSETWGEAETRIACALAEIERLLEREEAWRALGQLETREAAGHGLEAVHGALVRARLLKTLSMRPAYQVRERLREARRLAQAQVEAERPDASASHQEPLQAGTQRPLAASDDLTRLRGIDARLASELARLEVRDFATIAAWRSDDVRRVSAALGLGKRISRENWIEQAALLMARAKERGAGALPARASGDDAANQGPGSVAPLDAPRRQPEPEPAPPSPHRPVVRDILRLEPDRGRSGGVLPPTHWSGRAPESSDTAGSGPTETPAAREPTVIVASMQPAPLAVPLRVEDVLPVPAEPEGIDDRAPSLHHAQAPVDRTVMPQVEPPVAPAERVARPSAAIFAAPLAAVVPFIGAQGGGDRTIAGPLKALPGQRPDQGRFHATQSDATEPAASAPLPMPELERRQDAAAAKPTQPPTREEPGHAASPREVFGARVVPPARPLRPAATLLSRSDWTASDNTADAHPPAGRWTDEAEVEIVAQAPSERPLPRPEPRARLPRQAGAERAPPPRAVLKAAEAAEVVIVPRGAAPAAAPTAEDAAAPRSRLDVGRIVASWRGR